MDSAESVAPAETAESTAAEAPRKRAPGPDAGPCGTAHGDPGDRRRPRMRRTRREPRPRNRRKQPTHRNFILGKKVALCTAGHAAFCAGEQGLSMILVLCIGALFVALSAALVYAASVLTANANRQLLEQEAYQLATSFSDVLEGELNKRDSSFAKFVNEQFMFSQSYGKDIYDLESQPKEFAWKPDASQPDDGAEAITVTLRRRPGDGADKLNQTANSTNATACALLGDNTGRGESRGGMAIVDLQLDITVTVTKNGESFCLHADL